MATTLRKLALQTILPVLCGLIVLNAYLVSKNLRRIEKTAGQRVEASERRTAISDVALDLQTMETSQRGYLLTGDPSYLNPYNEADRRLAVHFGVLRSKLTGKDHSLEIRLESVAQSKIAEMKETIRLRQQGYRHRAFLIVGSNRGRDLMQEAKSALEALSSAQTSNLAGYDREMSASVAGAVTASTLASFILLLVTVFTFLTLNRFRKRLEVDHARQAQELRAMSLQLGQLTSTMFHQFRSLVEQMQEHANSLIDVYGGFLPRQGQEKAELIEDRAGRMIGLMDNLSRNAPPENCVRM
ncbi:MAG: CHASE3 domain-containing protein [Terriglobales bacterium]